MDWRAGAFHEHLDPRTLGCSAGFRRLRVAARQVYSFARAANEGVPRADEAVALGLDFLRRRARRPDGGYARRFDLAGEVVDDSRDLYDHAFVLLAFAAAGARDEALVLAGYLEARFRHPAGGYRETLPGTAGRRQDPHMHLLEACLAAAEAFGDAIFLDMAERAAALFLDCFFRPAEGVLAEALEPRGSAERHVVSPGHHCEWAWLIARYGDVAAKRRRPEGLAEAAAALMAFVDRHGIHPALGTLYDGVWSDGTVQLATARLWPQTERLKAEASRPGATDARIADAFAALDRHIDLAPAGLWREHLAADGGWTPEPAPASSLYHLTCGILESRAAIRARGR